MKRNRVPQQFRPRLEALEDRMAPCAGPLDVLDSPVDLGGNPGKGATVIKVDAQVVDAHVVLTPSYSVSATAEAPLTSVETADGNLNVTAPLSSAEIGNDGTTVDAGGTNLLTVGGDSIAKVTTPDLELIGLSCTIETLTSGHCESN